MPKSTISAKKIQNVKVNDRQDFVKILGIYFTKNLRTTGKLKSKNKHNNFQTTSVFKRKSHTSEFLDSILK